MRNLLQGLIIIALFYIGISAFNSNYRIDFTPKFNFTSIEELENKLLDSRINMGKKISNLANSYLDKHFDLSLTKLYNNMMKRVGHDSQGATALDYYMDNIINE